MPTITYSEKEYQALVNENAALHNRVDALSRMQPQWANEGSSASITAQVRGAALQQIWDHLGVTNQTHCMVRLQKLTDFFKDCGHDINEGA